MTEAIITVDLNGNSVMSGRSITNSREVHSIDVNRTNGRIIITEPYDSDGSIGGRVVIFPQSQQLGFDSISTISSFGNKSLYYPCDAKFDYVRGKIWILDTGNDRIISINEKDQSVNFILEDKMSYPHSVAVNLNTGGAFVKGFTDSSRTVCKVTYFASDGTEEVYFECGDTDSSSSSSSSADVSESSEEIFPTMPSYKSIIYDHVRSRAWWVNENVVYMMDERNEQLQTLYLDDYKGAHSIDIEYSTGNAFIVAEDVHDQSYVVQVSRDNGSVISSAYLGA